MITLNAMSHIAYFEPWLNFKTPIVRQLAFVVASPNIIAQVPTDLTIKHAFQLHPDHFWQQLYLQYEPRLQQLDQDPSELIHFLTQLKSTRLGLRFEYLMWFWLKDHTFHHLKLLGHSIQIFQGQQTLGEIDFLILNQHTSQIEHWEVALKYYLAEANFQLQHWYGLNRQDTLLRKLTHFTEKQFQFKSVQSHEIQQRFTILKGQLYYPTARFPTQTHSWVNHFRRLGRWGRVIPQQNYHALTRQEWICPDLLQSTCTTKWWTNGLYKQENQQEFYMYRQPNMLDIPVRKM